MLFTATIDDSSPQLRSGGYLSMLSKQGLTRPEGQQRETYMVMFVEGVDEGRDEDGNKMEKRKKEKKKYESEIVRGAGALPPCAVKEGLHSVVLRACANRDIRLHGPRTCCMVFITGAWPLYSLH